MAKKKVVLTGAAGTVGSALWPAWEAEDRYELTLVDRIEVVGSRSRVELGDLRDHAFASRVCHNQDVLVSLAYLRETKVGEADGGMTDIGMQMQLFENRRSDRRCQDRLRQLQPRQRLEREGM